MTLLTGLVGAFNSDTNGSYPNNLGGSSGTIYGATYDASGKINGCYSFDGTNDGITLPALSFSDQISISFWIYPNNFTNRSRPINNYHVADPTFIDWIIFQIDATTGLFKVRLNDTAITDYSSGKNLTSGAWNHIVVTLDTTANTIQIYIDDTKELDTTTTRNPSIDNYPFGLGKDAKVGTNAELLNGKIDCVYLRNKIVTSTEVTELNNGGDGLQYPFSTPTTTTNAGLLYMFT